MKKAIQKKAKKAQKKTKIAKGKNAFSLFTPFKKAFSLFIGSFKNININYLVAALYIVGFIAILQIIAWLTRAAFSGIIEKFEKFAVVVAEETELPIGAYISIYALFILAALAIILAFSVAEIGICLTILKKKFRPALVWKLFLVNIIVMIFAMIVLSIILSYRNNPTLLFALLAVCIILCAHFKISFDYAYAKEEKIKKALKRLVEFALKKIYMFILPVIAIIIVFLALSTITYFAELLPAAIYQALSALLLLFFIIWAVFYYSMVIEEVL